VSRAPNGSVTAAVLEALTEHGPMMQSDLCSYFEKLPNYMSGIISRLHGTGRIHIQGWRRSTHCGMLYYPRAVYAVGPGKDAKKPKPLTYAQQSRRARKLAKESRAVASVFDLGLTRRARQEKRREILAEVAEAA
jgi:hypothetical protein